ncbi:MAG TPA: hypothetical protein VGM37_08850 [Armatimonadota bacterium]|jgi:hypothetical protein
MVALWRAWLILGCLAASGAIADPVVVNVAGSGPAGWDNGLSAGNGALSSQAFLNGPTGVAGLTSGGIIVADFLSNQVRQAGQNGLMQLVAGDGWPGSQGSGAGPTTSIWGPWGVAPRGSGIVFSDAFNSSVRAVSSSGAVTQVAGVISALSQGSGTFYPGWSGFSGDNGPGSSAKLNWPLGVCTDAAGNVYVADSFNQRIRRIDTANKITTVAGSGWADSFGRGRFGGDGGLATDASLNWPSAVAVDPDGNLYIADTYNQRIRRVDAVTKIITTVAGTGAVGNSGDGGDATLATLSHPQGLAFGRDGTLYIADTLNNRIRSLSGGILKAVAGTGARGGAGDNGPALAATFNEPVGIAVNRSGDLLVADTGNNRVRMVLFGSTGWLHGTVIDAVTSQPVSGAVVAWNGVATTTDSAGAYNLALSAGTQTAIASAKTYGSAVDSVSVTADVDTEHNFVLPSGTVVGHVDDDAGHVVSGATVASPEATALTARDGSFTLRAAPGVAPLTASLLGYGSTTTNVTVPTNGVVSVRLTVNRLRNVPVTLTPDHDWISSHENPGDYNTASGDYAFPGEQLPASNAVFTLPTTSGPVDFLFPNKTDGANNVAAVVGQTISVPAAKYANLHLLESSQFGSFTGAVTLNYSDGSVPVSVAFSDWASVAIGQSLGANETVAVSCDHRHNASSGQNTPAVDIFDSLIPTDTGRTLVSFTLPADPGGSGSKDGWIFAGSLNAVGSAALYGDVDRDGSVTAADAAQALAGAAGLSTLTAVQVTVGDIAPVSPDGSFGDGQLDVADALAILRKALGA